MPYATNDGVRIYYEVEGNGQPLVLHTGFIMTLDLWRQEGEDYTAALRDTFQLILLDPRGQGRSDKPHDPGAYTHAARVGDVLTVLDDVDVDRAHYWGYSMGGHVGFMLGALAPDRLRSLIIGGASPYGEEIDPSEDPLYQSLLLGMDVFTATFERAFGPISKGIRERWLAEDAEALAAAWLVMGVPQMVVEALPTIHVPTLLYVGTEDEPDPVERAAKVMPDATFVALDGLNHLEMRPDLVLPHVLGFLERVERA